MQLNNAYFPSDPSKILQELLICAIQRILYINKHLLLYGIVDNFDGSNEKDICILKMLGYIEDLLISENVLSSDFTIIVAKNIEKL